MGRHHVEWLCIVLVFLSSLVVVGSVTNPNDFRVLNDFRNGLDNPELLKWPSKGNDPCGPPLWPHVFCSGGRVTQIQVRGLGLKGHLPQNLNQLSKLQNVGLQGNLFNGNLPSFSGLSELQFAYLDDNQLDTIPSDFFHGLSSVRVLALDNNPFNATTGWSIPDELQESANLANFSCSGCNLVGPLPDFFGRLSSLTALKLSYNNITGDLPSSFSGSPLQFLWLNNQAGGGLTGSIDVIGSMIGLTQLWLHENSFTGTIPDSITDLNSLKQLNLNGNKLVGQIPPGLANLNLDILDLNNNMLMGPIPKFKASNATYSSNSFCQPDPGDQCAPEVSALLDFLQAVGFPPFLASKWTGNDPCKGSWWGITCNPKSQVSIINLQKMNLNGTLSPSLVNLGSLLEIHLGGNYLMGPIPSNLTQLSSLRILDLSGNNFSPPIPKFRDGVKVITDDNPRLSGDPTKSNSPLSPPNNSPSSPTDQSGGTPQGQASDGSQGSKGLDSNSRSFSKERSDKKLKNILVIAMASAIAILILLAVIYVVFFFKSRKYSRNGPVGGAVHPRHPYGPDKLLKIVVAKDSPGSTPKRVSENRLNDGMENAHVPEDGDFTISIKVLRSVTNNFAAENELGRGGFGAVYKGEFNDGIKVAVKRMESGVITNKGLDEFHAEIAVLSKVRHRHLVSLLGYSIEENEKLLVYEYMPQGALSMHLFHWKALTLEPLSWTKRLIIALDVARGMEYLHNLAHQSFIHRDLKSSNILLGDDFRAKIADFGLVKLAPDRERSVATRLAGTFGYLAPEYAVTGKITTKVDVFSFGVVLMELVTGLMALDENRAEESRYLAEWFWQIKSNKEKLISAIDPTLDMKEEILDSICTIAELAGNCTSRDPNHRPYMGHAVNVLVSLVEKWTPVKEETEDESEMDMLPLPQMLKDWQEESADYSGISLQDSKGSIPPRPTGLAESFTSSDAR